MATHEHNATVIDAVPLYAPRRSGLPAWLLLPPVLALAALLLGKAAGRIPTQPDPWAALVFQVTCLTAIASAFLFVWSLAFLFLAGYGRRQTITETSHGPAVWNARARRFEPMPDLETPSAPIVPAPALPPAERQITRHVHGREVAPLVMPALTEAEKREAHWRRRCEQWLVAGAGLGKWNQREMEAAGIVSKEDWLMIVEVLAGAGLVESRPGRGTFPVPDYDTALAGLRGGVALPFPTLAPLPTVRTTEQSNTAQSSTARGER